MPSLTTLAEYHPQFALAIAMGVPKRPNMRTVQAQFANSSVPQNKPASFDQGFQGPGFVSTYSVFTGFHHSIDPTNAFGGNVLKTLSDEMQSWVSGITMTMTVRSDGSDYTPIPFDTPLQLVPRVLNPTAGMWSMDNPDNVKIVFTLQAAPPASPLTVWGVFSFLVLGEGARPFICMDPGEARAELRKLGIGCGSCGCGRAP
jgi:hypothetical protein